MLDLRLRKTLLASGTLRCQGWDWLGRSSAIGCRQRDSWPPASRRAGWQTGQTGAPRSTSSRPAFPAGGLHSPGGAQTGNRIIKRPRHLRKQNICVFAITFERQEISEFGLLRTSCNATFTKYQQCGANTELE